METKNKKLPVGIEMFRDIREHDFYYIDKTGFIKELLESWTEVNLFTRPRRFGKSLNMDMLKAFFEIGTDKRLFDGLEISAEKQICEEYMGKFPVISVSLKDVEGNGFEEAKDMLETVISDEALRFQYLMDSPKLTSYEKARFEPLLTGRFEKTSQLTASLKTLSALLYKHTGTEVIILIDEYDVPLDKAYVNGYYEQMVQLIRSLFSQVLKTNSNLRFAVITGCLRISKESIFTGINNFTVHSVSDSDYGEYFGFTDQEVRELLSYYEMEELYLVVKEWYDGYRFGSVDVYCPWDVINHVDRLRAQPEAKPQSYWINTSGNELVKRFVQKANKTTRDEIERLIAGEAIEKNIRLELTYDEIDNSIENLWSVLFTTGYLTQVGMKDNGAYQLVIPNREVREVYKLQIQEWFRSSVLNNTEQLTDFWKALEEGETESVEKYLNRILSNSISVFDTRAKIVEKESSYHTLLVGILTGNSNWLVKSNVEAGDGFADIIVETEDPDAGIIIELKYAQTSSEMEKACEQAVAQIKDRRYADYLKNDERNNILYYGIAFCRKRCKVVIGKQDVGE